MPSTTRLTGFVLIAIGIIGYVSTGGASMTALIPAMLGAIFVVLALAARSENMRKHVMHAAVALALLGLIGVVPRLIAALMAGEWQRTSVLAQLAMAVVLVIYVALGVKSFIDARRARLGR